MDIAPLTDPGSDRAAAFALLPREFAVFSPIPLRSHPFDVQAIDDQAVAWCLEHGLCVPDSRAIRMGCATGIVHGLPSASEAVVQVLTKYFYWGSLLDDLWDSRPDDLSGMIRHTGELQRVMFVAPEAPIPAGDRWAASLRDLRAQLENALTDEALAAFQHENAVWLNGQLWYAALGQRAAPPEMGEYLRMRWVKSGVGTLVPFTCASLEYQLDPWQLREPQLRAFTEAVMLACAFLNDLFSLAKEIVTGTARTNLFSVLARGEHREVIAGLAEGWQLYERIVVLAMHLRQQLLLDSRPEVVRFAADLPHWIPAGIQWASTTARYLLADREASRSNSGFDPPQITLAERPTLWDPDDLTPPPYPEIAWWWDQVRRTA